MLRAPVLFDTLFGPTAIDSSATAVVAPEIGDRFDLDTGALAAVFVAFGLAFAAITAV